jgi:hypothetical protein
MQKLLTRAVHLHQQQQQQPGVLSCQMKMSLQVPKMMIN